MTDEIERRPASENPWYVLMTIAGEQGARIDWDLHGRNRRFWHGWIGSVVDPKVRAAHCERAGIEETEFAPFDAAEMAEWEAAIADRVVGDLPKLGAPIEYDARSLDKVFCASRFLFPFDISLVFTTFLKDINLKLATFSEDTLWGNTVFHSDAEFTGAKFLKKPNFGRTKFKRQAGFRNVGFLGDAF